MKTIVSLALVIGVAVGQYGPPKQTGPKKHRTTTTEPPNEANEIQPTVYEESGVLPDGGSYQARVSNVNQPGLSVTSHSYTLSGPNANSNPFLNQPVSQNQPGGCGGGVACSGQSHKPIDISKNPFLNAGLSGVPVTSRPFSPPSPPQNQPNRNPFLPPNYNQPSPSGQPQPSNPNQPGLPQPAHPSGQPSQPGFPNQPFPGQGQPQNPQTGYPSGQPSQPGFPNQQFPGQGQPQNPNAVHPSGKPPQPGYPNQLGQPQNPQAGHPSGKPSQPGFPNQPFPGQGQPQNPQSGYPSGQPSKPGFPNQPFPGQGQPQNPQAGHPSGQPSQPGLPNQPFPGQGQPQNPQSGYPSGQPSKPGFPNQPFPGQGQPQNPQSGYPSGQPSQPGFPNQPFPGQGQPQHPNPGHPSGKPSQPGYPNQPFPGQGQPQNPQVGHPSGQPSQPGFPNQPFPGQGQPQHPNTGHPSGKPSQPGYPNQPFPGQGQPQNPQAGHPSGQPSQPGFPNQPFPGQGQPQHPNTGHPSGKPSQPGYPNQPFPGQGQPQNPQVGHPSGQPSQPGFPNQPFPGQGQPQNPQAGSSGNVPTTYACNGPHQFCVPQYICSNGYIADKSGDAASKYRKGQCSAGEVCCKLPLNSQPNYNYVTEAPQQKYTGPLNTTPPPECAAALKCVQEIYCTAEGVMSDVPLALSREQIANKVPLTDCQDPNTGVLGKCCRDPNYKDPWPAGMMMKQMNSGFDDGLYHPDKYPGEKTADVPKVIPNFNPQGPNQPHGQGAQYFPQQATISPPNPHTIKKPLGAFNTDVTPFPVVPKPALPPSQVFGPNSGPTIPQAPVGNPNVQNTLHPSQSTNPVGLPGTLSPNQPFLSGSQTPQGNAPFPANRPLNQNQQPPSAHYNSPSPGSPVRPGEKCGVRRQPYSAQTYGTGFGEFPWHVVILSTSNQGALCSGALIAPNAVLTAAHCIDGLKPEEMVVKAGEWTLHHPNERPTQTRVVAASAIHPVYSAGSLVKDQAVLVTEKPFNFDVHVDKVCLPAPGGDTYTPSTTTCYLTGWGRPALQNNQPGSLLNKVPINVTPKDECEQSLKGTHLGKYFILNEGFTCAAPFNANDLCKVDIGSPLVCERPDGQYELAGVYSWDTKCSSTLPGVMATCDSDWVNQVLSTPIETLKQQARPKFKDAQLPEDVDSKPGFALGYGK